MFALVVEQFKSFLLNYSKQHLHIILLCASTGPASSFFKANATTSYENCNAIKTL